MAEYDAANYSQFCMSCADKHGSSASTNLDELATRYKSPEDLANDETTRRKMNYIRKQIIDIEENHLKPTPEMNETEKQRMEQLHRVVRDLRKEMEEKHFGYKDARIVPDVDKNKILEWQARVEDLLTKIHGAMVEQAYEANGEVNTERNKEAKPWSFVTTVRKGAPGAPENNGGDAPSSDGGKKPCSTCNPLLKKKDHTTHRTSGDVTYVHVERSSGSGNSDDISFVSVSPANARRTGLD